MVFFLALLNVHSKDDKAKLIFKSKIIDLIAGGTDTSANVVEWAMFELLKHPNSINKATEELDRVIGRQRWVEEKDTPNLPYIDAIMKDTMSLGTDKPMQLPFVHLSPSTDPQVYQKWSSLKADNSQD
ncbi:Cytochrome P450 [Dillenia turbinata]|uniref:Cytochrome P450 n=1 Tax=Dillenia turbinata TaxID=194707 RepID=A0AAN8W4Q3_9MAGN